jgi:hypothetical protein
MLYFREAIEKQRIENFSVPKTKKADDYKPLRIDPFGD